MSELIVFVVCCLVWAGICWAIGSCCYNDGKDEGRREARHEAEFTTAEREFARDHRVFPETARLVLPVIRPDMLRDITFWEIRDIEKNLLKKAKDERLAKLLRGPTGSD